VTGKYSALPLSDQPIASRPKRRKVMEIMITNLNRIREAESRYLSQIPDNLSSAEAYYAAEEAVELMDEAIDLLASVY
jgi:hypothetical protein